jgi:hypothetical protein
VNLQFSRPIVILAGQQLDPRAAYAAADVVLGMGSSALRAMAIGKPVVVQGERAFSETFGPATFDLFLRQGFYGQGDDCVEPDRLVAQLAALLGDAGLRDELGRFGREAVVRRFGLDRGVSLLLDIYQEVRRLPPKRRVRDALVAAGRAVHRELQNHDPRRKRAMSERDHVLFGAAGDGTWPPVAQRGA